MRCTQIIGLKIEAVSFINDNIELTSKEVDPCPHCGKLTKTVDVRSERVYDDARSAGMFDDGPPLYEYILKDGRVMREVVQEVQWSSGPCIFLCLEDQDGNKMFEWDKQSIHDY